MIVEKVKIIINDAEIVSGVLSSPEPSKDSQTGIILAHGAGADMNTPLIAFLANGLCEAGYVTLRFNFPYKEKGRKAPDHQGKLVETWEKVFEYFKASIKPLKTVVAGKSMGGRVVSQMTGDKIIEPDGLIFFGYPLHPPGKKEKLRDAHLYSIQNRMLFFSGTRDSLCDLNLLRPILKKLKTVDLEIIKGGDHSFKLLKSAKVTEGEVFEYVLRKTIDWLQSL